MVKGEENVYSDETTENLVEDDEISPEEEGFMKGYNEAGESGNDDNNDDNNDDKKKEKKKDDSEE